MRLSSSGWCECDGRTREYFRPPALTQPPKREEEKAAILCFALNEDALGIVPVGGMPPGELSVL